ncbi:type II secretion system F family protein [Paenibacillus gansuensis]|uniref:Type II secretion system F family protein n=1 Tax=Paenibacillus gansuensis TaxID=306542 RepID=A0ABW5PB19_9BACL
MIWIWAAAFVIAAGSWVLFLWRDGNLGFPVLPRFNSGSSSSKDSTGSATMEHKPDYHVYKLSTKEKWTVITAAAAMLFVIGFIFYKSVLISLFFTSIALMAPRYWSARKAEIRKKRLQLSFRQMLYSLSTSLSAGRSVENAFREASTDLKFVYPDEDTDILFELDAINRKVENGLPLEKALAEFSSRAGVADITVFYEVFSICKRTGGDLVEVVRKTANQIGEKLETEQEIAVMIAQKKFESRIMSILPFVIIGFLSFGSADYMKPLYTLQGHLIMTVALLLIAAAASLSVKIMDINV